MKYINTKLRKKQLEKKYTILFFLQVVLCASFVFGILLNNVYSSSNQNYELMKKIVSLEDGKFKNLRLGLDLHQEVLTGGQPKFILIDRVGNRWLFKEQNMMTSKKVVAIYRFAKMCGINLPEVHQIILPVNGEMIQGTVERYISQSATLSGVLPQNLGDKAIMDLQNYAEN